MSPERSCSASSSRVAFHALHVDPPAPARSCSVRSVLPEQPPCRAGSRYLVPLPDGRMRRISATELPGGRCVRPGHRPRVLDGVDQDRSSHLEPLRLAIRRKQASHRSPSNRAQAAHRVVVKLVWLLLQQIAGEVSDRGGPDWWVCLPSTRAAGVAVAWIGCAAVRWRGPRSRPQPCGHGGDGTRVAARPRRVVGGGFLADEGDPVAVDRMWLKGRLPRSRRRRVAVHLGLLALAVGCRFDAGQAKGSRARGRDKAGHRPLGGSALPGTSSGIE